MGRACTLSVSRYKICGFTGFDKGVDFGGMEPEQGRQSSFLHAFLFHHDMLLMPRNLFYM